VDADFLPHEPTYDFVSVDGRARCGAAPDAATPWGCKSHSIVLRSVVLCACLPIAALPLCATQHRPEHLTIRVYILLCRIHCMKRALPLVKPEGGVFMLDNSGRLPARYHLHP